MTHTKRDAANASQAIADFSPSRSGPIRTEPAGSRFTLSAVSARTRERLKRYPENWREISLRIRERSGWQCECEGECGLHRTTPGPRRCCERNGEPAKWAKGKIILTVAHLNHIEADCRDENLKAMCQRCHLRYDMKLHQQHAAETRRANRRTLEMPF